MIKDLLKFNETIFLDQDVFNFSYIPEKLLFRENQIKDIASCVKPAIKQKSPLNCMLNGKPATGKTSSIHLIFEELEEYSKIRTVHINCRIYNTNFRVYSKIYKKLFGYSPPDSGISVNNLYEKIFNQVSKEKIVLIIALDEAFFLEKCDEIIYQLIRTYEIFENVKIGLMLVLSEKEKYIIQEKSESVFRPKVVNFQPYNFNEIFEILKLRSKIGFYPEVITDELIEYIVEKSINYDLRFAIELLKQSGLEAEEDSSKKIELKHINNAHEKLLKQEKRNLGKPKLENNEKVLMNILKDNEKSSGELYKIFNKINKISYSSFYRLIKKLEKKKLIKSDEKQYKKGRTRMIKKL